MAREALIDANVFMYAAGGPHLYRDACRHIVGELARGEVGGFRGVVNGELFQEVAYRYACIRKVDVGRRIQASIRALPLDVLPVDEATVDCFLAVQHEHEGLVRDHNLSIRDLVHLAVMERHGIEHIVSADKDFDRFQGLTRIDPMTLAEAGETSR